MIHTSKIGERPWRIAKKSNLLQVCSERIDEF